MSHITFLMVMDGAVLIALAGMMVFAAKLSKQLSVFKRSREDLRVLVRELSDSVVKAQAAINGMKENARITGKELQNKIDQARDISDELQLISEANAARTSRRPAPAQSKPAAAPRREGFAIRDPDADKPSDTGKSEFRTQAERELFEAMRRKQGGPPKS